jgi:endonuclease/exonuclease/phosphatase family metal-dependent hydrolase
MRIMSYNIRYDGGPQKDGIDSWSNRKEFISLQIKAANADIIGVQEALINQLDELSFLLPGYKWVGSGRDDGNKQGEFSAIIFKESEFTILDSGTFWLSETPDKPSKGWDAVLNRIATWAKMKSLRDGTLFYFFNTHFDHLGIISRKNSAELIIKKINELAADLPVILTGDFNDPPNKDFYKIITAQLNDAKMMSAAGHQGPELSFIVRLEQGLRIDYIFVNNIIEVLEHHIIKEKFNGRYPSDHFPVLALIKFKQ